MGVLNYYRYNYRYFLCMPNKEMIGELKVRNDRYKAIFKAPDELSFDIDYYEMNNSGTKIVKNPDFDLVKENYLVLMERRYDDELKDSQYFLINSVKTEGIEKDLKSVTCYSLETILKNKKIRDFERIAPLVTPDEENAPEGILNYIIEKKLDNTWSIGDVDNEIKYAYRSYDISEQSILELFADIEDTYNCVFLYDTVNQIINIKLLDNIGENKGLVLNEYNYLKNISIQQDLNDVYTRIWFYGENDISINRYNITGLSYIDIFDAYRTPEYMSQGLLNSLYRRDLVLQQYKGQFENYLDDLYRENETSEKPKGYYIRLQQAQAELADLEAQLAAKKLEMEQWLEENNRSKYDTARSQYNALKQQVSNKRDLIEDIEGDIGRILDDIADIGEALQYSRFLTPEQLKELNVFIREEVVRETKISDGKTLYEYALTYAKNRAKPKMEFDLDVVDILSIRECQEDWDKINLGDLVYVSYDKFNIDNEEMRIIQYEHDPNTPSLKITISTDTELKSTDWWFFNLQRQAYDKSKTANNERDKYKEYDKEKNSVIKKDETIDTSKTNIKTGSEIEIDRSITTPTASNGEAIKLNAKGIVGTTDNWLTYRYILTGQGLSLEGKNQRIKIDITTNDSSNQHPFSIKQGNGNGSYNNEVFYVDRNGNVVAENATIRVNRAGITNEGSNNNSIRIWAGKTYENRNSAPFRVTQSGKVIANEAEIKGTFATGEEGTARTIISANGIQSYNSSNRKHGLWCNSSEGQRFSDLILYYNGYPIFTIENGISHINLYAFGSRFLSVHDKTVDFTSANAIKINNVNGTFTTADGKIITIQNGVVTNIS